MNSSQLEQLTEDWDPIFDSLTDIVSVHDLDFNIIKVNQAFADLFQMRPEDFTGKKCYRVLHGQNDPWSDCPYVRAIRTKLPADKTFFEPYLNKHLSLSVVPIFSANGEPIGTVQTAKDITKQVWSEEAAKQAFGESKKESPYYNAILDTAGALIMVLDKQGRIVRFNRYCISVSEYSFEEVLSTRPWDFLIIPEDVDRMIKDYDTMKAGILVKKNESTWKKKHGGTCFISWSNTVLLDNEDFVEYIICIGIDMTEQIRAIKERDIAEKQVNRLERLAQLGQFTSSVSHELNNNLDILLTKLFLLQNCLSDEDQNAEIWNYVFAMKQQLFKMSHLSKDILQYVHPLSLVLEFIELESIIDQVANSFHELISQNIQLTVDVAPDLPLIKGDRLGIEIVFKNIIRNSIESIKDQGKIFISVYQTDEDTVDIRIEDSGKGISKKNMKEIFDPFFSTKKKMGGTGLGLPMCKHIIESQHASIVIESKWNKGTVVTIRFPVCVPE